MLLSKKILLILKVFPAVLVLDLAITALTGDIFINHFKTEMEHKRQASLERRQEIAMNHLRSKGYLEPAPYLPDHINIYNLQD